MDAIKIENYEREHGGGTFPPFGQLNSEETVHLFSVLKQRLRLSPDADALHTVRILHEKSMAVENVGADAEDFDLKALLNQLEITTSEKVLLNWYRFDRIDEIRTSDLCRMFDDIWYPSSDDVHIFDETMTWVLSIAHYGAISLLRFTSLTCDA
jgi:hypothetical protein